MSVDCIDDWPRCRTCGDPFWPTRDDQQYCSQLCHAKTRRLRPRLCALCGQTFTPKRSERVYCSRVCANKARIVIMGDESVNQKMADMREKSAALRRHRRLADVEAIVEGLTPAEAYVLAYKRGRKAGIVYANRER